MVLGAALGAGALGAGKWAVEKVTCCYGVYPAAAYVSSVGVQEIRGAVAGLWRPPGDSPSGSAFRKENPGRAPVVLYDDFEGYRRDVHYFGVVGLFYPHDPEDALGGPLGELARREPGAAISGCCTVCCLPTRWGATLAHELTHLIQHLWSCGSPNPLDGACPWISGSDGADAGTGDGGGLGR